MFLLDAGGHFEHGLLFGCNIGPKSVKLPRDVI
jgi:hypothetical protein